jgi:hypothetical protein
LICGAVADLRKAGIAAVLILGNHGLVVGAVTCKAADALAVENGTAAGARSAAPRAW